MTDRTPPGAERSCHCWFALAGFCGSPWGGQTGPCYLGTRREDSCIRKAGPGWAAGLRSLVPSGRPETLPEPSPGSPAVSSQGRVSSLLSRPGILHRAARRTRGEAGAGTQAWPSWLSFPQHWACWAVLAQAPAAPASKASQTDPGTVLNGCAAVCGHSVWSLPLPLCPPSGSRPQPRQHLRAGSAGGAPRTP